MPFEEKSGFLNNFTGSHILSAILLLVLASSNHKAQAVMVGHHFVWIKVISHTLIILVVHNFCVFSCPEQLNR